MPLVALLLTLACAPPPPPIHAPGARAEAADAAAAASFTALEGRLLTADPLAVRYRIHSVGAFAASLQGELVITKDSVRLDGEGMFGAEPVTLRLAGEHGRVRGGSGDRAFDEPEPPGLREALVLGLTRMGLLHNLARLAVGSPPDRADGTLRDWVQAVDVLWNRSPAPPASAGALGFGIVVGGRPVAEAVLWLGPDGLPLVRAQTVRFPGGEMRVREEYVFGEGYRP